MNAVELLTLLIDTIEKSAGSCSYSVIQNTWADEEDEELLIYFKDQNIKYSVLTDSEIYKENPVNIDVLFADTSVIQKYVSSYYNVPDTYPQELDHLYHRKIGKIKFSQCLSMEKPFFIKPCGNTKEFDAMRVTMNIDLDYLSSIVDKDDQVYCCDLVKFVNEYRLFIADNKIFAMKESSHYILDSDVIKSVEPPQEFLDEVLNANTFNYCAIDIGLIDDNNDKQQWAVVEVNPPFALSDYGLEVEKYYEYCKSAWNAIKQFAP